jgi:hypothetical protein
VSATQSGTCSLDVGTTGTPLQIRNAYTNALSTGSASYPIANFIATLVYDAHLGFWIKHGGDSGLVNQGLASGWPYEDIIRLCGEVGAHPHICMPHLALDPMTDFVSQCAAFFRNNGPSWMVPRFEGPNEQWNNRYFSNGYGSALGTSYGWSDPVNNWYGKVMSTIGQDISAAYSADRTKYQVLAGVQTGLSGGSSANRLDSVAYVGSTPQTGYTATAAKNWVTTLCVATYITPKSYNTGTETTQATAMAGKTFDGNISGTTLTVTNVNASASYPFASGDTVYGNPVFFDDGQVVKGTTITSVPTTLTITSITQANPGIVTVSGGTPPVDGTRIYIAGAAASMTQLTDGWYTCGSPSGSTFTLQSNAKPPSNRNTTAFSAYTSGGTIQVAGPFTISTSQTVSAREMSAVTDPTQAVTFLNSVNDPTGTFTVPACAIIYSNWKTYASGRGVNRMCAYEGGYSPDLTAVGNSSADFLRTASKYQTGLFQYEYTNCKNFTSLTGGGFTAEFVSAFEITADPFANGYSNAVWAILEDIYSPVNSVRFESYRIFNTKKRRLTIST